MQTIGGRAISRVSGNYTIQCRDVSSGIVGDFLFDVEHWKSTGEFKAISPIFYGLSEFYAWDNANGRNRNNIEITRECNV